MPAGRDSGVDAHSVTSADGAAATTPLARTRRHSFGGGGVDRALIESARRRAAVQAAALVDARSEIAVVRSAWRGRVLRVAVVQVQLRPGATPPTSP